MFITDIGIDFDKILEYYFYQFIFNLSFKLKIYA